MIDTTPTGDECNLRYGWRKSLHSMSNGHCVEAASLSGCIGVRDSQAGSGSPVLRIQPQAWSAFLAELRTIQEF
jgi:hypothetical protein